MYLLNFVNLRRALVAFVLLGAAIGGYAQAPATVSATVVKFSLTDALHRTLTVDRWLRADGSFQDLSVIVSDPSINRSAALTTGSCGYMTSGAVGELVFQPATTDSLPSKLDLTFADSGAGTLAGAFTGFGTNGAAFSLRPEASSTGVMNVSCRTTVTPGAPAIAGFVVNSQ